MKFPPAAHARPIPIHAFAVLRATIEALAGRRPLHAVRRIFAPQSFQALSGYVDATLGQGLEIHSIAAQMPHARAVEATVTVRYRGRQLACALRLDQRSRWLCSQIELVGLAPAPFSRAA